MINTADSLSLHSALRRLIWASALVIGLVSVGACKPASASDPGSDAAASSSAPTATAAAPATEVAASAAPAPSAQAETAIDYGVLGPPDTDSDPKAASRSAQANLTRFRYLERHPPQGTVDHPIDWMTNIEINMAQRARFYAAEKANPSLITDQDRKWLKADEDAILSLACGNLGAPGAPILLTEQDCAGVKADG